MKKRILSILLTVTMLIGFASFAVSADPDVKGVVVNPAQPYSSSIWADKSQYNIGDNLKVNYRVDKDAYVYVFDIDTQGNVILLFPNIYTNNNYARAGATYTLPDNSNYKLSVAGPNGVDTLVMFAVPTALSANDIQWLKSSLATSTFGPKVNSGTAYDFMSYVKGVNIVPTYGNNWSSASTTFVVGSGSNVPNPVVVPITVTPVVQKGSLSVTSNPQGAKVFVDGYDRGVTPINISDLVYGKHDVVVIYNGYYSYKSIVDISSSVPYQISANLTLAQGASPVDSAVLSKTYTIRRGSLSDINEIVNYRGSQTTVSLKMDEYFGAFNGMKGYVSTNFLSNEFMNITTSGNTAPWIGRVYEVISGQFRVQITVDNYSIIKDSFFQTQSFDYITVTIKAFYIGN